MPTHQQPQPGDGRLLRRRVVFELAAAELPLLEAAERAHGSKRAGLVAALRDADRLPRVEAARAEAEERAEALAADLAALRADHGRLSGEVKRLRDQLASAGSEAAAARKSASDARRQRDRSRGDAEARLERLQAELAAREAELDELDQRAVDALYCARCDTWAAPAEWAWRDTSDGQYAYHQPCGDHPRGLLDPSSRLAWRR